MRSTSRAVTQSMPAVLAAAAVIAVATYAQAQANPGGAGAGMTRGVAAAFAAHVRVRHAL